MKSAPVWFCPSLALCACASSTEAPPSTDHLAIEVAPLDLPGIDFACCDLLVQNQDGQTVIALGDPATSLLSPTPDAEALCSTQYGNGTGDELDPAAVPIRSQRFGGSGDARNTGGLAAAPNGDVLISGAFSEAVDFGGGNRLSAGGCDVFVARLDANGAHVWSQGFCDHAYIASVPTAP